MSTIHARERKKEKEERRMTNIAQEGKSESGEFSRTRAGRKVCSSCKYISNYRNCLY